MSKEIDVTCPCCQARLNVDVRTSRVVRWARPEETDSAGRAVVREEDWDAALGKVRSRRDAGTDKFDASLERERRRAGDLDELFRQASRRALRPEDDESEEAGSGGAESEGPGSEGLGPDEERTSD